MSGITNTGMLFIFASRNGHLSMVKLLLNHGAIPHRVTKRKLTALHMAAIGGHIEVAKVLLEHGLSNHDLTEQNNNPISFTENRFEPLRSLLEQNWKAEPLHLVLDGKLEDWIGCTVDISGKIIMNDCDCSGTRIYLGSWESISAWWLNSLEIDCVVSAMYVDEAQPDGKALRFLLDSIKDGENKRRIKRTSSELSKRAANKSKAKAIKRLRDQRKNRQGLTLAKNVRDTDSDDTSMSVSQVLVVKYYPVMKIRTQITYFLQMVKSPGAKPINLHDAENKLLRKSYEYDADGNVTVIEPDEEIIYPLYPKIVLEHLHIDLPSNTVASKADWLRFLKYQPSISQYIDEKTKAGKRILIACYDGTNIGPAILSTFLMTKEGYERRAGYRILDWRKFYRL